MSQSWCCGWWWMIQQSSQKRRQVVGDSANIMLWYARVVPNPARSVTTPAAIPTTPTDPHPAVWAATPSAYNAALATLLPRPHCCSVHPAAQVTRPSRWQGREATLYSMLPRPPHSHSYSGAKNAIMLPGLNMFVLQLVADVSNCKIWAGGKGRSPLHY